MTNLDESKKDVDQAAFDAPPPGTSPSVDNEERMQEVLKAAKGRTSDWTAFVNANLSSLTYRESDTSWPRDTLYQYLWTMSELQVRFSRALLNLIGEHERVS